MSTSKNEVRSYITIARSIQEWEWFDDPSTLALFIHLLLDANYKEKKWHGITLHRGQLVTSIRRLSEHCGLSINTVQKSLSKLESSGAIKKEPCSRYSLVTIVHYSHYQGNGTSSSCAGSTDRNYSDTVTDTQADTLSDNNINKKENNNIYNSTETERRSESGSMTGITIPSASEVQAYADSIGFTSLNPAAFIAYYDSRNWMSGHNLLTDWKAAVRFWKCNSEAEPQKHCTFRTHSGSDTRKANARTVIPLPGYMNEPLPKPEGEDKALLSELLEWQSSQKEASCRNSAIQ